MFRHLRIALLALAAGCGPLTPLSCGSAPDVGQFGPYVRPFKLIRLPNGDTLTVYRVAQWTFADGSPPALQIEYQTRTAIGDTLAVRAEQRKLWPVFESYVAQAGLSNAILTATDRVYRGGPAGHVTRMRHFGTIAVRDSIGTWRFVRDRSPLPAGILVGNPAANDVGIFERSGVRVTIAPHR